MSSPYSLAASQSHSPTGYVLVEASQNQEQTCVPYARPARPGRTDRVLVPATQIQSGRTSHFEVRILLIPDVNAQSWVEDSYSPFSQAPSDRSSCSPSANIYQRVPDTLPAVPARGVSLSRCTPEISDSLEESSAPTSAEIAGPEASDKASHVPSRPLESTLRLPLNSLRRLPFPPPRSPFSSRASRLPASSSGKRAAPQTSLPIDNVVLDRSPRTASSSIGNLDVPPTPLVNVQGSTSDRTEWRRRLDLKFPQGLPAWNNFGKYPEGLDRKVRDYARADFAWWRESYRLEFFGPLIGEEIRVYDEVRREREAYSDQDAHRFESALQEAIRLADQKSKEEKNAKKRRKRDEQLEDDEFRSWLRADKRRRESEEEKKRPAWERSVDKRYE